MKKTFKHQINMYLLHRSRLGYVKSSVDSALLKFAKFADRKSRKKYLTAELAIDWATKSKSNNPKSWKRRLTYLHTFAKYYKPIDPKTEIPPLNIFPSVCKRPNPYIYTKEEINGLIKTAQYLHSPNGFKSKVFQYLLGLLASTGMRISEAIKLKNHDVDFVNGSIYIRETKFHKSRCIPIHRTVVKKLKEYVITRDKIITSPMVDNFFITQTGHKLHLSDLGKSFRLIRKEIGLVSGQRMYDLRHTFACSRLLDWYKKKCDINKKIIFLTTYLGHAKVSDTYWYLTATPCLMALVAKKFEKASLDSRMEVL